MAVITLLLSSRERKALFRALQRVYRDNVSPAWGSFDRVDALLDELDDAGIWNPCLLTIPDNDEKMMLVYSMRHAESAGHYAHELRMIEDRLKYVDERRDGVKKTQRWPFLTAGSYYGPN